MNKTIKNHIVEIEVSPRKGETVLTRWHVWQITPCPDIWSLQAGWRNAEGLLPSYGNPGGDLAPKYRAGLLRPDWTPDMPENRIAYSGYDGNPCAVTIRGREIGEVSAHVSPWPGKLGARFDGGYGVNLTPGERSFFADQCGAALVEYIETHAAELRADALAVIRARMEGAIREAKERIATLDDIAQKLFKRLEAGA